VAHRRLAPDFKTIANFRRDNGPAIRAACSQFIELCRRLNLFTKAIVAIDAGKFKAVNNRNKNFTLTKVAKRMEQVDASIARYLTNLDRADREESDIAEAKTRRIKDKIVNLRRRMQALKAMEQQVQDAPDKQVSLTDPDARSTATSGRGTGMVGYNVQTAVDAEHHLIVAHEVTNLGHDRTQLEPMARKALADRGYFNGEQVLARFNSSSAESNAFLSEEARNVKLSRNFGANRRTVMYRSHALMSGSSSAFRPLNRAQIR